MATKSQLEKENVVLKQTIKSLEVDLAAFKIDPDMSQVLDLRASRGYRIIEQAQYRKDKVVSSNLDEDQKQVLIELEDTKISIEAEKRNKILELKKRLKL